MERDIHIIDELVLDGLAKVIDSVDIFENLLEKLSYSGFDVGEIESSKPTWKNLYKILYKYRDIKDKEMFCKVLDLATNPLNYAGNREKLIDNRQKITELLIQAGRSYSYETGRLSLKIRNSNSVTKEEIIKEYLQTLKYQYEHKFLKVSGFEYKLYLGYKASRVDGGKLSSSYYRRLEAFDELVKNNLVTKHTEDYVPTLENTKIYALCKVDEKKLLGEDDFNEKDIEEVDNTKNPLSVLSDKKGKALVNKVSLLQITGITFIKKNKNALLPYAYFVNEIISNKKVIQSSTNKHIGKLYKIHKGEVVPFEKRFVDYINTNKECALYKNSKGKVIFALTQIIEGNKSKSKISSAIKINVITDTEFNKSN